MAMNDPSQLGAGGPSSSDLDGLLEILRTGVTNLSPNAALPILQNWQAQLQAMPALEAQTVAGDLAQLYDILGSDGGMEDGTNVGALLTALGSDIRALVDANADVPGLGEKLTELASLLESQGMALNDNGA